MSDAVRAQPDWPGRQRSRDIVGAMANVAAAGEVAARGAVGGVQAVCLVVRNYPVLSVFLASGLGYLLGRARGSLRERPYVAANGSRR
jgi:hypothetical protein